MGEQRALAPECFDLEANASAAFPQFAREKAADGHARGAEQHGNARRITGFTMGAVTG